MHRAANCQLTHAGNFVVSITTSAGSCHGRSSIEASELYYDEVSQIVMEDWCHGHVSLVGDACCAVSLLAGQGASLAMAGAYTLAHELDAGDVCIPDALSRYVRKLKPLVDRQQALARRNIRWLVPNSRWLLALRNAILKVSLLPGLSGLLRPVLAPGTGRVTSCSQL